MPKGEVPRYKEVRCRLCGKLIHRFDRSKYPDWHVSSQDIFHYIRLHYKEKHPRKFKESIKKGVEKRQKK